MKKTQKLKPSLSVILWNGSGSGGASPVINDISTDAKGNTTYRFRLHHNFTNFKLDAIFRVNFYTGACWASIITTPPIRELEFYPVPYGAEAYFIAYEIGNYTSNAPIFIVKKR